MFARKLGGGGAVATQGLSPIIASLSPPPSNPHAFTVKQKLLLWDPHKWETLGPSHSGRWVSVVLVSRLFPSKETESAEVVGPWSSPWCAVEEADVAEGTLSNGAIHQRHQNRPAE